MLAPKTIDTYLKIQPVRYQKTLKILRDTIHTLVPEATECISYGIPTFKLHEKAFAGFGAYKTFLSFYPFSGQILAEFQDELSDYKCTKSAIHFTPEKPLPESLIKKIILKKIETMNEK